MTYCIPRCRWYRRTTDGTWDLTVLVKCRTYTFLINWVSHLAADSTHHWITQQKPNQTVCHTICTDTANSRIPTVLLFTDNINVACGLLYGLTVRYRFSASWTIFPHLLPHSNYRLVWPTPQTLSLCLWSTLA